MTFDPFGDFETRGYLRNLFGEKDPEIVRHLEHSSFVSDAYPLGRKGGGAMQEQL